MSRQRIRTGVFEGSAVPCPHCAGAGMVRSTSSIALHVLRVLEDTLIKSATHNLTLRTRTAVALYVLNQKRMHIHDLEARFGVTITVAVDETLTGMTYHAVERGEPATMVPSRALPAASYAEPDDEVLPEESELDDETASEEGAVGEQADLTEGDAGRRRGRRRRRRGRERESSGIEAGAPQPSDGALSALTPENGGGSVGGTTEDETDVGGEDGAVASGEERLPRRRRRSRRGARGGGRGDHGATGIEANDGDVALAQDEPAIEASEPMAKADASADLLSPLTDAEALSAAESIPPILSAPPPEMSPAPASAPEALTAAEDELDPSRPKRTGWWQRAKATLRG